MVHEPPLLLIWAMDQNLNFVEPHKNDVYKYVIH